MLRKQKEMPRERLRRRREKLRGKPGVRMTKKNNRMELLMEKMRTTRVARKKRLQQSKSQKEEEAKATKWNTERKGKLLALKTNTK